MAVGMAAADLAPPPNLDAIPSAALFLDFDGTLVELADSPDAIDVPRHLASALERKARELNGRLALVSGRHIGDLRKHLPRCAIVMSGSHGAEVTSPDGSPVSEHAPPSLHDEAWDAARAFERSTHGLLLERKTLGLGLHYRECPERRDDIRAFAQDLADQHGLHVRDGKMVIELATTDSDKGVGLRAIMGDPPFAGGTPVFLGDDTTDEDGFRAAQELGGFGVLVGEPRETAARYRLPGVEAVHQWLELA